MNKLYLYGGCWIYVVMKAYIKYATLNTTMMTIFSKSDFIYLFICLFILGLKHVIKYNKKNTE